MALFSLPRPPLFPFFFFVMVMVMVIMGVYGDWVVLF